MLKTCYCVLTNARWLPEFDGDVVGVDKGALICHEKGIAMKMALGDFDSITIEEKMLLNSCDVITLNPRKDVSDSEAAVLWAQANGYERIVLVTSMSGRFDHSVVNYMLVKNYGCELLDEQNHVFMLKEGQHHILKQDYKYISFFAMDTALITLKGFSYDLNEYELNSSDVLCLSNELIENEGVVITTGRLWCIQSSDTKQAV